jgi:predicted nuclease of predicted toxin-antitoxin system
MVRKFHKHKLLLDEGFPIRSYFPLLNSRFDVKHITKDFKQVSLSDKQVHKFAAEHDRIVVTLNIKDFKPLSPTNKNTGVIGVSANLPYDQVDKKLTALLNKSTRKQFLGMLTVISGESQK